VKVSVFMIDLPILVYLSAKCCGVASSRLLKLSPVDRYVQHLLARRCKQCSKCESHNIPQDFVPPQYIDLFIAAQDSIPQWPIDDVVNAIDTSLNSAFGLGFDDVFQSIESSALGSASIGQVHKAKLKSEYANLEGYNGGEIVAVKVMHRGAEERFHHDFKVFRWLCKIALQGWEPILDECHRQIMSEFDYRREAGSLERVRENMAKSPFHRRIRIPEPLSKLCSKELLIMEMLEGKNLSDAIEDELALALGGKDKAMAMIRRKRLGK
jgi:aarF domain-containing kinase